MAVTLVDHPLAGHLLAQLRSQDTSPPVFRTIAKRLALALTLEAIRELPTTEIEVADPARGDERAHARRPRRRPDPARRASGMLEAVTELFPEVAVGYIGLERDEASLQPQSYYRKLPPVRGRHVLVARPDARDRRVGFRRHRAVKEGGPASIRFVCVVSAPEGIERMEADHPDVPIFTAAIDRQLNEHGYIVPGLGDFGDRLFGT